ncbi:MAG: ATP-binding cassette domain-containing protein, partial [Thermodesulfobacteriota bacterium]
MGHIKINNLCKEFVERRHAKRNKGSGPVFGEKIKVLDDINLEFQPGEMVCILGPSGCGKSTMLRIIAGFDQPSSGQVFQDGKQLTEP